MKMTKRGSPFALKPSTARDGGITLMWHCRGRRWRLRVFDFLDWHLRPPNDPPLSFVVESLPIGAHPSTSYSSGEQHYYGHNIDQALKTLPFEAWLTKALDQLLERAKDDYKTIPQREEAIRKFKEREERDQERRRDEFRARHPSLAVSTRARRQSG